MGNKRSRFLTLCLIMLSAVFMFAACGEDPYALINVSVPSNEITVTMSETDLSKNKFEITASVSGIINDYNGAVSFVVPNNPHISYISSSEVVDGKTTGYFSALSPGKSVVTVQTNEGGKSTTVIVNVVMDLQSISTVNNQPIPLVRGQATNISSYLSLNPQGSDLGNVGLRLTTGLSQAQVSLSDLLVTANQSAPAEFKLQAYSKSNDQVTKEITFIVIEDIKIENIIAVYDHNNAGNTLPTSAGVLPTSQSKSYDINLEVNGAHKQTVYLMLDAELSTVNFNNVYDVFLNVYTDASSKGDEQVGSAANHIVSVTEVAANEKYVKLEFQSVVSGTATVEVVLKNKNFIDEQGLYRTIMFEVESNTIPKQIEVLSDGSSVNSLEVYTNYNGIKGTAFSVKLSNEGFSDNILYSDVSVKILDENNEDVSNEFQLFSSSSNNPININSDYIDSGLTYYIKYLNTADNQITGDVKLILTSVANDSLTKQVDLNLNTQNLNLTTPSPTLNIDTTTTTQHALIIESNNAQLVNFDFSVLTVSSQANLIVTKTATGITVNHKNIVGNFELFVFAPNGSTLKFNVVVYTQLLESNANLNIAGQVVSAKGTINSTKTVLNFENGASIPLSFTIDGATFTDTTNSSYIIRATSSNLDVVTVNNVRGQFSITTKNVASSASITIEVLGFGNSGLQNKTVYFLLDISVVVPVQVLSPDAYQGTVYDVSDINASLPVSKSGTHIINLRTSPSAATLSFTDITWVVEINGQTTRFVNSSSDTEPIYVAIYNNTRITITTRATNPTQAEVKYVSADLNPPSTFYVYAIVNQEYTNAAGNVIDTTVSTMVTIACQKAEKVNRILVSGASTLAQTARVTFDNRTAQNNVTNHTLGLTTYPNNAYYSNLGVRVIVGGTTAASANYVSINNSDLNNKTITILYNDDLITAAEKGLIIEVYALDSVGAENVRVEIIVDVLTGTEVSPYEIKTVKDLKNVNSGLDKHYVLTSNIDLNNTEWLPIGLTNNGADYSVAAFTGSFSGSYSYTVNTQNFVNNYTISNLKITNNNLNYYGLFAVVGVNAQVNNVNIQGLNINLNNITNLNNTYVGAVAGLNLGSINNAIVADLNFVENYNYENGSDGTKGIFVTAENSAGTIFVGAIAGLNNLLIVSPSADAEGSTDINHTEIPQSNITNAKITNPSVSALINVSLPNTAYVGGVVGLNNRGLIEDTSDSSLPSVVTVINHNVLVVGINSAFGGVVGFNTGIVDGVVAQTTIAFGDVLGNKVGNNLGGIAGYNSGSIVNNTAISVLKGNNNVGGVVGLAEASIVSFEANGISYNNGIVADLNNFKSFTINKKLVNDFAITKDTVTSLYNFRINEVTNNRVQFLTLSSVQQQNLSFIGNATMAANNFVGGIAGSYTGVIYKDANVNYLYTNFKYNTIFDYSTTVISSDYRGTIELLNANTDAYAGAIVGGLNNAAVELSQAINTSVTTKISTHTLAGVVGYASGVVGVYNSSHLGSISGLSGAVIGGIIGDTSNVVRHYEANVTSYNEVAAGVFEPIVVESGTININTASYINNIELAYYNGNYDFVANNAVDGQTPDEVNGVSGLARDIYKVKFNTVVNNVYNYFAGADDAGFENLLSIYNHSSSTDENENGINNNEENSNITNTWFKSDQILINSYSYPVLLANPTTVGEGADKMINLLANFPPSEIIITPNPNNTDVFIKQINSIDSLVVYYYQIDSSTLNYNLNITEQAKAEAKQQMESEVLGKNTYNFIGSNNLFNVKSIPSFVGDSNYTVFSSNNNIISVEKVGAEYKFIVKGTGKVTLTIRSNYGDVSASVEINVVNAVNKLNLSYYNNGVKTNVQSQVNVNISNDQNTTIQNIYFDTKSVYETGDISANYTENSSAGVRLFYAVPDDSEFGANLYHNQSNIAAFVASLNAGLSIGSAKFTYKAVSDQTLETRYFVYADVAYGTSLSFSGTTKQNYRFVTVPYLFDGNSLTVETDNAPVNFAANDANKPSELVVSNHTIVGLTNSNTNANNLVKVFNVNLTDIVYNVNSSTNKASMTSGPNASFYVDVETSLSEFSLVTTYFDSVLNQNVDYTFGENAKQIKLNNGLIVDLTSTKVFYVNNDSSLGISFVRYYFTSYVDNSYKANFTHNINTEFEFKILGFEQVSAVVNIEVTPEPVSSIIVKHYPNGSALNSSDNNVSVEEVEYNNIILNTEGVLKVFVSPNYASYDSVEIELLGDGANITSIYQLNAVVNVQSVEGQDFVYYTGDYHKHGDAIYTNKLVLDKSSYLINGATSFDGSFYVRTLVGSGNYSGEQNVSFKINVVKDNQVVLSYTKELSIVEPPAISISVNGEKQAPTAIGTELEFLVSGDDLSGVSFAKSYSYELINGVERNIVLLGETDAKFKIEHVSGNTYKLITDITTEQGTQFKIIPEVSRVINGQEQFYSDYITVFATNFVINDFYIENTYDGLFTGVLNQTYKLVLRITDVTYNELKKDVVNLEIKLLEQQLNQVVNNSSDVWTEAVTDLNTQIKTYSSLSVGSYPDFVVGTSNDDEFGTVLTINNTNFNSGNVIAARVRFVYTEYGIVLINSENADSYENSLFKLEKYEEAKFNFYRLYSEDNPTPIYTVEEFNNMLDGVDYILMNDLTLTNHTPLSADLNINSLDGNGYVITLNSFALDDVQYSDDEQTSINLIANKDIGIFSQINEGTTIKNLIIEIAPKPYNNVIELASYTFDPSENKNPDLLVDASAYLNINFGILAGQNQGNITNVQVVYDANMHRVERDYLLGSITEEQANAKLSTNEGGLYHDSVYVSTSNTYRRDLSVVYIQTTETTDSYVRNMGGLVGVNSGSLSGSTGYITNSSVENISINGDGYVAGFVADNLGKVSTSYFKGGNIVNRGTHDSATAGFAVFNDAETSAIQYSYVQGRLGDGNINALNNYIVDIDKTVSLSSGVTKVGDKYEDTSSLNASKYDKTGLVTDSSDNSKTMFAGVDFIRLLADENADLTGAEAEYAKLRALNSMINSSVDASGFVYVNAGLVSNSYSNILVKSSSKSSGFAYSNESLGVIESSYTLSSIYQNNASHSAFIGRDEKGSYNNLNPEGLNEVHWLQLEDVDYKTLDSAGNVSGTATYSDHIVYTEEEPATKINASDFYEYNTFQGYAFNPDLGENEEERVLNSVWFMPTGTESYFATSFKNQYYNPNAPQLVGANQKTISIRRSAGLNEDGAYVYDYVTEHVLGNSVLNPILISSAEAFNQALNYFEPTTTYDRSLYLRFIQDIGFNQVDVSATTYKYTFTGSLDGNGMTINDYRVSAEITGNLVDNNTQYLGLFGKIASDQDSDQRGVVKNLNLNVSEVNGTKVNFVGALAGEINSADVFNIDISSESDVIIQGNYATGALAGIVTGDSNIVNISSSVGVKSNYFNNVRNSFAANQASSLITQGQYGSFNIFDDYNSNDPDNSVKNYSYAGGIVGVANIAENPDASKDATSLFTANIRMLTTTGNVTIIGEVAGGVIGYVGEFTTASDLKFIVADNTNPQINGSRVSGGIAGENRGEISRSFLEHSKVVQQRIDLSYVDALEDANSKLASLTSHEDNYNNLFGSNPHYVGGIVGFNNDGLISNSYNRINVENINSMFAGGVVGLSIGGRIEFVYTTSSVMSFYGYGGVIGYQLQTKTDETTANNKYLFVNNTTANVNNINNKKDTTVLHAVVAQNIYTEQGLNVNRDDITLNSGFADASFGAVIGEVSNLNGSDLADKFKISSAIAVNDLSERMQQETNFFVQPSYISHSTVYDGNNQNNATETLSNEIGKVLGNSTGNSIANSKFENDVRIYNSSFYAMGQTGYYSVDTDPGSTEKIEYFEFNRLQNIGSSRTYTEFIEYDITTQVFDVNDNVENTLNAEGFTTNKFTTGVKAVNPISTDKINTNPIYGIWNTYRWTGTDKNDVADVATVFPFIEAKPEITIIRAHNFVDLKLMQDYPNADVILMDDITVPTDTAWQAVGTKNTPYRGTISSFQDETKDGIETYTIKFESGATIINGSGSNNYVGFVGYAYNATFENFNIEFLGATTETLVEDNGRPTEKANFVGSLVGYSAGVTTITDVNVKNANISTSAAASVGGVVGYAENATITNVGYNGNINVSGFGSFEDLGSDKQNVLTVGGVVGYVKGSNTNVLTNVTSNSTINVIDSDNKLIAKSITEKRTLDIGGVAGIVEGYPEAVTATNLTSDVEMDVNANISSGSINIGGYVGISKRATYVQTNDYVKNSAAKNHTINVSSNLNYGGFIGNASGQAGQVLTNDFYFVGNNATINTDGNHNYNIGGFVGFANLVSVTDTYVELKTLTLGSFSGNAKNNFGGFIGELNNGSQSTTADITDVYAIGNIVYNNEIDTVTEAQNTNMGGLFGKVNESDTETLIIENVVSNVNVKYEGKQNNSTSNIGGIAGQIYNGSIANSVSLGLIEFNADQASSIGGFVGEIGSYDEATIVLNNNYSTSDLSIQNFFNKDSGQYAGLFVGKMAFNENGNLTMQNNFTIGKYNYVGDTADKVYLEADFKGGFAGVIIITDLINNYNDLLNYENATISNNYNDLLNYENATISNNYYNLDFVPYSNNMFNGVTTDEMLFNNDGDFRKHFDGLDDWYVSANVYPMLSVYNDVEGNKYNVADESTDIQAEGSKVNPKVDGVVGNSIEANQSHIITDGQLVSIAENGIAYYTGGDSGRIYTVNQVVSISENATMYGLEISATVTGAGALSHYISTNNGFIVNSKFSGNGANINAVNQNLGVVYNTKIESGATAGFVNNNGGVVDKTTSETQVNIVNKNTIDANRGVVLRAYAEHSSITDASGDIYGSMLSSAEYYFNDGIKYDYSTVEMLNPLADNALAGSNTKGLNFENDFVYLYNISVAGLSNYTGPVLKHLISIDGHNIYKQYLWNKNTTEIAVTNGKYVVSNAEELAYVANLVNNAEVDAIAIELDTDIDLSGKLWTPIGTKDNPFNGTFNGKGYSITGLSAYVVEGNAGLFGDIVSSSNISIENVTIYNSTIIAESKYGNSYYAGAIAGFVNYKSDKTQSITMLNKVGTQNVFVYSNSTAAGLIGKIETEAQVGIINSYVNSSVASIGESSNVRAFVNKDSGIINFSQIYITSNTLHNGTKIEDYTNSKHNLFGGISSNNVTIDSTYLIDGSSDFNGVTKISVEYAQNVALPGFDFDGVWTRLKNSNNDLPILRAEPAYWSDFAETLNDSGNTVYVISEEALAYVANQVNSGLKDYAGKTILINTSEIDLSGKIWTPIGTESNSFKGTFDFNGKTISGLDAAALDDQYYTGLFGVTSGATITSSAGIGTLTGESNGSGYVGGLAGQISNTTISNLSMGVEVNNADVLATGGVVAYASTGTNNITNVETAKVTIRSTSNNVGGLVGENNSSSTLNIADSVNNADIIADGDFVGGLVGSSTGTLNINGKGNWTDADNNGITDNPDNTGQIVANDYVGGIVGRTSNGVIEAVTNAGTIEGEKYVGGIIGENAGNSVYELVNTGNIYTQFLKGSPYVGSVIGSASDTTMEQHVNLFNNAEVQDSGKVTRSYGETSWEINLNELPTYEKVDSTLNNYSHMIGGVTDSTPNISTVYNAVKTSVDTISGKTDLSLNSTSNGAIASVVFNDSNFDYYDDRSVGVALGSVSVTTLDVLKENLFWQEYSNEYRLNYGAVLSGEKPGKDSYGNYQITKTEHITYLADLNKTRFNASGVGSAVNLNANLSYSGESLGTPAYAWRADFTASSTKILSLDMQSSGGNTNSFFGYVLGASNYNLVTIKNIDFKFTNSRYEFNNSTLDNGMILNYGKFVEVVNTNIYSSSAVEVVYTESNKTQTNLSFGLLAGRLESSRLSNVSNFRNTGSDSDFGSITIEYSGVDGEERYFTYYTYIGGLVGSFNNVLDSDDTDIKNVYGMADININKAYNNLSVGGLFGEIDSDTDSADFEVENLNVKDVYINASTQTNTDRIYAGGIAGYVSRANISYANVDNSMVVTNYNDNSHSSGGVVGYAHQVNINNGTVSGNTQVISKRIAGGVVGNAISSVNISNMDISPIVASLGSAEDGLITSSSAGIGGVIGIAGSSVYVEDNMIRTFVTAAYEVSGKFNYYTSINVDGNNGVAADLNKTSKYDDLASSVTSGKATSLDTLYYNTISPDSSVRVSGNNTSSAAGVEFIDYYSTYSASDDAYGAGWSLRSLTVSIYRYKGVSDLNKSSNDGVGSVKISYSTGANDRSTLYSKTTKNDWWRDPDSITPDLSQSDIDAGTDTSAQDSTGITSRMFISVYFTEDKSTDPVVYTVYEGATLGDLRLPQLSSTNFKDFAGYTLDGSSSTLRESYEFTGDTVLVIAYRYIEFTLTTYGYNNGYYFQDTLSNYEISSQNFSGQNSTIALPTSVAGYEDVTFNGWYAMSVSQWNDYVDKARGSNQTDRDRAINAINSYLYAVGQSVRITTENLDYYNVDKVYGNVESTNLYYRLKLTSVTLTTSTLGLTGSSETNLQVFGLWTKSLSLDQNLFTGSSYGGGSVQTIYTNNLNATYLNMLEENSLLVDPTLSGAQFDGWYNSTDGGNTLSSTFDFDLATRANATAYAKWNVNLTFDANGGTITKDHNGNAYNSETLVITLRQGQSLAASQFNNIEVDNEGIILRGWFDGASEFDTSKKITSNSSYSAVWGGTYFVTFNLNGGNIGGNLNNVVVETNNKGLVVPPADPLVPIGTFKGWSTEPDGTMFLAPTTKITKDITYYAVYEISHIGG